MPPWIPRRIPRGNPRADGRGSGGGGSKFWEVGKVGKNEKNPVKIHQEVKLIAEERRSGRLYQCHLSSRVGRCTVIYDICS